jgi:high-affinity iron transporter
MRRRIGAGRSRTRAIVLGAGLALVAAVLGGVLANARGGSTPSAQIIVSDAACGPGWVAPAAGRDRLSIENRSRRSTFGVDLVGGDQVSVYGEIETLAPGTRRTLDAVLPPGRYTLECESFSGGVLSSQSVQVEGHTDATAHPFTPVSSDQVHLATLAYRARLTPELRQLERDTDSLTHAVVLGRLDEARVQWLPAHLDYARLGAVYDTFGALDGEIDGRPAGLAGGDHDPHFRGFLRLEYGLWHGQPVGELVPVARGLDRSVHDLVRTFPRLPTGINDLSLRSHEILENSLQFELTGDTDEGSHSGLATTWANVQGTELALDALAPLLRRSDPVLTASAMRGLAQLEVAFKSYERPDGSWRSLRSLSRPQREQLDGRTSALLEQLSRIPDELEIPRRPPSDNDGLDD